MKAKGMVQMGFRCSDDVAQALAELAEREHRSVNGQMMMMIVAALRQAGFPLDEKGNKIEGK